jgi:hypothetical protein
MEFFLCNKGATKIFQERFDDELILWLQHRAKQGVFHRLSTFSGLKTEQIGHESLLQNILKQTAPCWTRCIYHYPPLTALIWKRWRSSLPEENMTNVPINLPKGWQNNSHIADTIIKGCPFCPSSRHSIDAAKIIGNLEHLHLYCTSPIISDVRHHCSQKNEHAIPELYNFASMCEYQTPFQESPRATTLQGNLEEIAL